MNLKILIKNFIINFIFKINGIIINNKKNIFLPINEKFYLIITIILQLIRL